MCASVGALVNVGLPEKVELPDTVNVPDRVRFEGMVVVPLVDPKLMVVAAPPMFKVVTVWLSRLKVVWSVNISPPLAIRSPWDVMFEEQLNDPLLLVTEHPEEEDPPPMCISPVEALPILIAPVVPALRDIDVLAVDAEIEGEEPWNTKELLVKVFPLTVDSKETGPWTWRVDAKVALSLTKRG